MNFAGGALVAGAAALVAPRGAQGAEAKIDVLLDEPIGAISPDIYGHFAEHIGGVIYDGIWVGQDSKVPNVDGIRRDSSSTCGGSSRGVDPLARRLLRRQVRLARRHRPARQASARALLGRTTTDRPTRTADGRRSTSRTTSAPASSSASAASATSSPTSPPTSAPAAPRSSSTGSSTATRPAGSTTLADERAAHGDREPFDVALLGRRQRVLGLRRPLHARGLRDGVSQVHRVGPVLPT